MAYDYSGTPSKPHRKTFKEDCLETMVAIRRVLCWHVWHEWERSSIVYAQLFGNKRFHRYYRRCDKCGETEIRNEQI